MSCKGCADSFGFLKKEYGCPKCGFAYCKKCLRFKIPVGGSSSNSISVCYSCSIKSSEGLSTGSLSEVEKSASLLTAFFKLESLENPDRPPITLYRENSNTRLGKLKRGLSVEDQKIVERLEGLRETGSGVHSKRLSENPEEEVAMRLAMLKGEDPAASASKNKFSIPKSAETDSELFMRLSEQVMLDKKHNESMVSDIEERLAKLRQTSDPQVSSGTATNTMVDSPGNMEDISEEDQVKRLIERFTKEVELEAKTDATSELEQEAMNLSSEEDDVDVDSLCRICDEKRAIIKCTECDDDIFCKNCFLEFHKELGEVHKPTNL